MKKILISVLCFVIFATLCSCPCEAKTKAKTIKKQGYAIAKYYSREEDFCSMKIKLKNGKTYMVEDFVCPLGSKCSLYFRKGKIVKVVATTRYRGH